jgi:hypothetical protein
MQSKTSEKEEKDKENLEQVETEEVSEEILDIDLEFPTTKSEVENTEVEKKVSFYPAGCRVLFFSDFFFLISQFVST